MVGTETAVELEVISVVQEGSTQREEKLLESQRERERDRDSQERERERERRRESVKERGMGENI